MLNPEQTEKLLEALEALVKFPYKPGARANLGAVLAEAVDPRNASKFAQAAAREFAEYPGPKALLSFYRAKFGEVFGTEYRPPAEWGEKPVIRCQTCADTGMLYRTGKWSACTCPAAASATAMIQELQAKRLV